MTDVQEVTPPRLSTADHPESMGTVIQLRSAAAEHPGEPDPELAHATSILQRLSGPRSIELPGGLGRHALRAEMLLEQPPTRIDVQTAEPGATLTAADAIISAADTAVELIGQELLVLGDALATDLTGMTCGAALEVAEAVLALAVAPRASAMWGDPTTALAAEVALEVAAEDLRGAAAAYERLYAGFTEDVWGISGDLLHAGRRRWRVIARARLRNQLSKASRTSRVGSMSTAITTVMRSREAHERRAALAPLLSHHLGSLDRGPLSDIDAAMDALRAVRRLQASLGDHLDRDRFHWLLLADAFDSPDVVSPAVNVRNAVQAWEADVDAAGGEGALDLDLGTITEWAARSSTSLPALAQGHRVARSLGLALPTVRALVNALLLRERTEELVSTDEQPGTPRRTSTGS